MKKLTFIAFFALLATIPWLQGCAQAQFPRPIAAPTWYHQFKVDQLFWLNTTDTTSYDAASYPGALVFQQVSGDTALYVSNGVSWLKVGTGTGGSGENTNQANSNLTQDSSSRTYNLHGGNFYQRDGDSMWTVTSRDSIGETLQNPSYSVSRWMRGDGRQYFDIRDRASHVLLTRVEVNRSGLYLYTGVHGADTSVATIMIGAGGITVPSLANNATLDSVTAPSANGTFVNRWMPKTDSIMTPSKMDSTLSSRAIEVALPLILDTLNHRIYADTSRGLHSLATQHEIDSLNSIKFNKPSGTTSQYVRGDGSLATLPSSAGGGISKIGTGWGLANVNDSTNRVDTAKVASLQALIDTAAALRPLAALTLDQVLTNGASSSIGITVGTVQTIGLALISGTMDNIPVLGTDGSGVVVASTSYILPDIPINSVSSTTYTVGLSDKQRVNSFTSSSDVTITIPTNASVAFPVGTRLILMQSGTGQLTVTGASGVTVGSLSAAVKSAGQYGLIELLKTATNTWVLFGALQ